MICVVHYFFWIETAKQKHKSGDAQKSTTLTVEMANKKKRQNKD